MEYGFDSRTGYHGYKWSATVPNIIGIRTTLQVPDVFNDFLCLIFKQPAMASNYNVLQKQKWLNKWSYKGKDGKKLAEDGKSGSNTKFALAEYNDTVGKERLKIYVITADPGLYYQNIKLLNPKGCAVLKPGQYINCYQLGKHKKADHKALVQTGGKITVYRDNDRDGIAENLGVEALGFELAFNSFIQAIFHSLLLSNIHNPPLFLNGVLRYTVDF